MDILGIPILSFLIFFPLEGVILLLFIKKEDTIRWTALVFSLIEFVVSLPLFWKFNSASAVLQFLEDWWWVEAYGISYKIGIDGISPLLVLLSTFLTVLCILCSWTAITFRVKEYMISNQSIICQQESFLKMGASYKYRIFARGDFSP